MELNPRGDSLARERRRFVMYQAEPREVSTATGFSWQENEDGHADWPGDLAGNGAGKDETGSGELRTRSPHEIAASSFVCTNQTNGISAWQFGSLLVFQGREPGTRANRGEYEERAF